MPKLISRKNIADLLQPGMTVYMPNCAGESLLTAEELSNNPDSAKNIHFVGVWIPGVNSIDYTSLHETTKATSFFVTPALRNAFNQKKLNYVPLHYSDVTSFLRSFSFDLALLQLSPPDSAGNCSFGLANDFPPSIINNTKSIFAHINPNMPTPPDALSIPYEKLDYVYEEKFELIQYDLGKENNALIKLGENVSSLIDDGDTIEIGIGKIQSTVLKPLQNRKNLRIHGGMICDPLIDLVNSGAISNNYPKPITTGVAVGTNELYKFVNTCDLISFKPVTFTHDIEILSSINNLIAINSAIEVDLLGQANAEMIKGKQVSGGGGLVDFLRGARRSKNGKAIVALVSTTSDGKTSRIVSDFAPNTISTVPRADIDYVITENGIADLRNKNVEERAYELIEEAAAPQFREQLKASIQ